MDNPAALAIALASVVAVLYGAAIPYAIVQIARTRDQSEYRGTQYASEQITLFAAKNGITRSMGYTGICWDNAMAESFFATLKTEFYYRWVWPTRARVVRGGADWIEDHYTRRRRYTSIGHVTPADFEMQYSSQAAEIELAA